MLAVESRFYECRPVICRKTPTFWGFVSRSKKKNNLKIRALCRIIGEHGFSHLLDNLQITYLWYYSVCAVRYNMSNFRTFFGMQFVRLSTYIDLDIYQLESFFQTILNFCWDKNVNKALRLREQIKIFRVLIWITLSIFFNFLFTFQVWKQSIHLA